MYINNIIFGLISMFFAVTFLQSGLDKYYDRSGNLSWFKSQFEKTILNKWIEPLFYFILIQELIIGVVMLAATGAFLLNKVIGQWILFGLVGCLFVLVQLFIGQRIAKDYPGASGIIGYIILAFISVYLCGLNLVSGF